MYYKYKFGNKPLCSISREEGNFFILSDGSQINKDLFRNCYIPADGNGNTRMNESYNNNTVPVMNNGYNLNVADDQPIDADIFFQNGANRMKSNLIYEVSNLNNPQHQQAIQHESAQLGSKRYDENARINLIQGANYQAQEIGAAQNVTQGVNVNPGEYVSPYSSNTQPIKKSNLNVAAMGGLFEDAKIEGVRNNRVQPQPNQNPQQNALPNYTPETYQQDPEYQQQYVQQPVGQTNPMFSKIKRKHPHTFTLKIEQNIADPDFIKIMDNNMEDSLIELFAEEFTRELLKNPEQLKQMFIDELEVVVYGKKKPKPVAKKPKKLKAAPKQEEATNDTSIVLKAEPKKKPLFGVGLSNFGITTEEDKEDDPTIDKASGRRIAPVDPRFAHLPPVLEYDEDNVRVIEESSGEDIDPNGYDKIPQ